MSAGVPQSHRFANKIFKYKRLTASSRLLASAASTRFLSAHRLAEFREHQYRLFIRRLPSWLRIPRSWRLFLCYWRHHRLFLNGSTVVALSKGELAGNTHSRENFKNFSDLAISRQKPKMLLVIVVTAQQNTQSKTDEHGAHRKNKTE